MLKCLNLIVLFLLCTTYCFAQNNNKANYPFNLSNLNLLSEDIARNDSIFPVYNNGKFTYINTYSKQTVGPFQFDEAYPFDNNYALVKSNGKYGIINKRGNYVLKPQYRWFEYSSLGRYGNSIWLNDTTYFSPKDGTISKNGPGGGCDDPVFPTTREFKEGKRYGLIFGNDTNHTKPIFDSVFAINYGFAIVKQGKKVGFVSYQGKAMKPFLFDDYAGPKCSQYAFFFAVKKKNIWHYYYGGKEMFGSPNKPETLNYDVFIFKTGPLFNYMNSKGEVMLPENYKWIADSGNLAINQKNEVVLFDHNKTPYVYYRP